MPANSVNIKLKINPGDTVAAVVQVSGTNVLVQVIDRTRKTRFTKNLTMAAPDLSSAEWIAEAPSECSSSGRCDALALTNFGSVNFTRTFATGNGVGGTISSPNWMSTAIQLVPDAHRGYGYFDPSSGGGSAGAAPGALLPDGSGFSVTWQANPAAT